MLVGLTAWILFAFAGAYLWTTLPLVAVPTSYNLVTEAELAEHGHELSPGTLYPALLRMERNGWLARSGKAAHVRARRTFRITREGRRLLVGLRREVTELYKEVVLGRDSEPTDVRPNPRARSRAASRKQRRPHENGNRES